MAENSQCCLSCLSTGVEANLQQFAIQCEPLKAIFQVEKINLCYLCSRLVRHTEMFIQNVQSNQILLENLHGDIPLIQSVRAQVQPAILSLTHLPTIELTGSGDEDLLVFSSRDLRVKVEMKEESDHLEGEFLDGSDDFQEPYVKEEDSYQLNSLLKEEVELDSIDLKSLQKTLKRRVKKKKVKKKGTGDNFLGTQKRHTTVHIREAQCIAERDFRAQGQAYLSSPYKCEPCARGFALLQTYRSHLTRHCPSRGEYECSICTIRYGTAAKLAAHKKDHTQRYKCLECDLIYTDIVTLNEHFETQHSISETNEFKCPQCPKVFTRWILLRKHKAYRHSGKDKVLCEHCHKTYVNKDSLQKHIMRKHSLTNHVSLKKRYPCKECGLAFQAPSHLKIHSVTHSDLRPFYCVECDRSFKTAYILTHHLKTAAPHVNYAELPLHCQHCDKRFGIKRDLVRHTNRVHLNIKPYSCDKCERSYINSWSLMEHKRYTHEGVKRPLRYPCHMCDKVFDRNSILKSHARTHTGERPYICSRCPAAFAQSSALGTHVRLIHLKLTRAGKPKTTHN